MRTENKVMNNGKLQAKSKKRARINFARFLMKTLKYRKKTASSPVCSLFPKIRRLRRTFVVPLIIILSILALWLAIPDVLEAAISNPVSGVNPGWSDNRTRVVFYNGDRFFLIYYKGGDTNLYYQSSTDNVTWSGETLLFSSASSRFDLYLVDDGKFDIVYVSGAFTYVRTCTISGATITAGTASTVANYGHTAVAVARSGGNRIYVAGQYNSDYFRVFSANQIGDAQNTPNLDWTQEINDTGCDPTYITAVPYEGVDKVLVVYQNDGGGTGNDGVRSIVVAHPNDEGEKVIKNYGSLPDFSSPIRISDTDFRIIIENPSGGLDEWKWDGVSWGPGPLVTFDSTESPSNPSLFYDRISGDMYAFAVDTVTGHVERYSKPNGQTWQAEVVADEDEGSTRSCPITQMVEPPYGSSRSVPRALVWGYRVGTSPYDLKVGTLGLAPKISSGSDQVFQVGQAPALISPITITEPGAPTITSANDLRIAIDTGVDMTWDTSVTTATFSGTGAGKVSNPVSYDPSGRVLIIPVNPDFAANDTLTIEDLYFKNFATANPAKVGLKVFLGGAGDTAADSWDVKTIMIKGIVTLGDHSQGQVGDKFAGETESETTTEFFRFQLTNDGEPASTTLTVDLSNINGIVTGDITNAEIWVDKGSAGEVDGNGVVDPATAWTTYATTESDIYHFAYDSANNVIYATTGSDGIILRCDISTGCDETTDWTISYDDPTETQLRSLIFDSTNNVIYVGTSPGGVILRCDTSTGCDETTDWTTSYDTDEGQIYSLTFDSTNNVIYAGSFNAAGANIFRCDTSTGCDEAKDWTICFNTTDTYIRSLIFDSTNNVIYAGSYSSGIIYRCDTSTGCDEVSDWTTSYDTAESNIYSLTFDSANNVIYAGSGDNGIIYRCDTSTGCDGPADWTTSYDTSQFYIWSLTFDSINNVIYAGTGSSNIIYSCDTSTGCDESTDWTTSYSPASSVYALTFDPANDVIYGGSSAGTIYRKFEGDYRIQGRSYLWTERTAAGGYSGNFYSVAHDGSALWTAVGSDGEIQTSPDGITWTERTAAGGYSGYFDEVVYGGTGLWIAGGLSGEIQTSPDGNTWTKQTPDGGYSGVFNGFAYDGTGLWVAVASQGEIQTSPDAVTWTHRDNDGGFVATFYDVAHDGTGLWVAVGTSGEIQTSPDGITWTARTPGGGFSGNFYGVAHDGTGLWVAVGSTGEIQTSPNGITWTHRTSAAGYSSAFNCVAHDGSGLWTAVGVYGEIQTSPDGINWTARLPAGGYSDSFRGVAYNGSGLWTVVGSSAEIQTSWAEFGKGLVNISGSTGTITFNEVSILPAGTTDYLLRATISNIVDGDTITFGLDPSSVVATGEVSDQSLSVSGSAASITHTRGVPEPYLTQIHSRWRNDNGGELGATWATNEDTALSILSVNTRMRLRFEISNEGTADSLSTEYLLEYATSTDGPWEAVPVSATTEHWEMVNSTYFTDGASTSNIDPGLSDENTNFFPGKLKDTSNQTAGITLSSTEFTEIEYCIRATANVTRPETYYFRLTNAGTPLGSYIIYGRVNVGSSTPWFDSNWPYRKLLRIDCSRVAGDLANFPVLINITDENLIFSGSPHAVNHVAKFEGGDIVFTTDNGVKLDHELEKYEPSTGELVAWVEVPSLSGSHDTFIYIYYGYSGAEDQWNVNGTWDEAGGNYYRGVWHLKEEQSGSTADGLYQDSTSNNNDGDDRTDGTGQNGQINGGQQFSGDGDADYVQIPHHSSLNLTGDMTISFWMYATEDSGNFNRIVDKDYTTSYYFGGGDGTNDLTFYLSNTEVFDTADNTFTINEWHYAAVTYDSATGDATLILDGIESGSGNYTGGITGNTNPVYISHSNATYDFAGYIDEVRISSVPRSVEWIQTSYNNQFAPAAFYTVGIEEKEDTGGDPFQNGWSYRKQITVQASEVPSDQTNFPVLVRNTDADWAYTGGGHVAQSNGEDILFTDSDGIIKLDHEIEDYEPSTGKLVAWVEVPSLSGSKDTPIYIYYGNINAVDQENPTGAGVWEPNYKGVWHLKETPTVDSYAYDSTSNDNDGTFEASMTSGDQVAGEINGSLDFDGNGDFVRISRDRTIEPSAITISYWVKRDGAQINNAKHVYKTWQNDSSPTYQSYGFEHETDSQVVFYVGKPGGFTYVASASDALPNNTWVYVVGTYDPSGSSPQQKIYIDAGIDDSTTNTVAILYDTGTDADLYFAVEKPSSPDYRFDGAIDEVRVSNIARSPDWILTEHNNQKVTSSFYSVGDECDGSSTAFSYRRAITINAGQVSNTEAPDYLTDFPVLVSLSHATLKNTVNGGYVQNSQGYDIIFRDSTDLNQLDHEIEEYDGSTGTLLAWVRVPTVSKTSDTLIYMYYGNCGISCPTENPAGVWSANYKGVWHLKETPTVDSYAYDSTSYNNDCTFKAGMTSDDQVSNKIDGSLDFDGSVDDYLDAGSDTSLIIYDSDFTFEAWAKLADKTEDRDVITKAGDGTTVYAIELRYDFIDDYWEFNLNDGAWKYGKYTQANPQVGTWYHLAGVRDGGTIKIYVDGVEGAVTDTLGTLEDSSSFSLLIGRMLLASDPRYFQGQIDEVRVSSVARTRDWIITSFNNENNPGNIDSPGFYTVGNEDWPAPTAVDLKSFTATGHDETVLVEWETAQEVNNLGFNLYRSTESNGSYTKLNKRLIPGPLSSVTGHKYSYSDTDVTRSVLYYYLLEDVDLSGVRTMHGPVCVDWDGDSIPDDYIEKPDDDDSDGDSEEDDPEVKIPDLELYEIDFGAEGWTPSSNIGSGAWVKLASFRARQEEEGIALEWETSFEIDNLGFHVYRELDGEYYRITPDLVPGSVFKVGAGRELPAGQDYVYFDGLSGRTGRELYWLDCVELNGRRVTFGPIEPEVYGTPAPERLSDRFRSIEKHQISRAETIRRVRALREELGYGKTQKQKSQAVFYQFVPDTQFEPRLPPSDKQWALSAKPAVKISVKEDGWYRVGEPELVAAGLDSGVDPRLLQLYTDGEEQSIKVTGSDDGRFDPEDSIEFHGIGLDTPFTDARVYWLVVGDRPGRRVETPFTDIRVGPDKGMRIPRGLRGRGAPLSFPYIVELKERTFYFAALKNGEEESFFGSVISTDPVNQLLTVGHADPSSPEDALLEVVVQGATDYSHLINIQLNYRDVGQMVFSGQERSAASIQVPQGYLQDGDNIVTLEAQGGDLDVSLVDYIRLTYWRTYTADEDALKFTAMGGEWVTIGGFSSPEIRVVDTTHSMHMFNIRGRARSDGSDYAITFKVPRGGERTLFAFSEEKIKSPSGITANRASSWHEMSRGADIIIIGHGDFLESIRALKELREQQGWTVVQVDVEDLYDEFNFGAKSPWAMRDFLGLAYRYWNPQPRYLILVGDSSYDPRNYLGYGEFDLVPTKFVDTEYLKTASDDWFVDFNDDELPEMAVGRFPVESAEEVATLISKIISYEGVAGSMNEALLVADVNDFFDFEGASTEVRSLLPGNITVSEIFRGKSSTARTDLLDLLNQGQLVVNYLGHGSTRIWRGNLLTSLDAWTLTNSPYLPFLVSMTCLNGFFQDPYDESLAETFMKAPLGGAVAVWASSGLTHPGRQVPMNKELIQLLFNVQGLTIGEAIMGAKQAADDQDIRRTWILFGDPTLRLR
jgi:hypothetical protein